jgi:hypothetical protein
MTAAALPLLLCVIGEPADLSGLHELVMVSGILSVEDTPVGWVELRRDRLRHDTYTVRVVGSCGEDGARGHLRLTPTGAAASWNLPYGGSWEWSLARQGYIFRNNDGFLFCVRIGKR